MSPKSSVAARARIEAHRLSGAVSSSAFGEGKRHGDAVNAGRPAEPVEQLAQNRAADETTKEIASEIDPRRRTAVAHRRFADEAGRSRLRQEGADGDQRQPAEDCGDVELEQQRQAQGSHRKRRPERRARADAIVGRERISVRCPGITAPEGSRSAMTNGAPCQKGDSGLVSPETSRSTSLFPTLFASSKSLAAPMFP